MTPGAIEAAMAARTVAERVDAALALAGLMWGQFARLTGSKRAHLHGARQAYTLRLVADYTDVDLWWLATGRLPDGHELPPKPAGMTDEDYARLGVMMALLGARRADGP